MRFIKQLSFFQREIVAAEAFHIFECIEELVFLIGVCQRSRIGAEQILQWPNGTPFTPVVN